MAISDYLVACQDDPLGHVAIPVAMAPGEELKRLRFALDRVAHLGLEGNDL